MLRTTTFVRANFVTEPAFAAITLDAQDRHLRRKVINLQNGEQLLVDLEKAAKLENGDCLVLDDGRLVKIIAAAEDLIEITARDNEQLINLAWHIGNRHLEAQIELHRILIRPDHVIAHMLEHQGAVVKPVRETFSPEHGAYHAHGDGAHEH